MICVIDEQLIDVTDDWMIGVDDQMIGLLMISVKRPIHMVDESRAKDGNG